MTLWDFSVISSQKTNFATNHRNLTSIMQNDSSGTIDEYSPNKESWPNVCQDIPLKSWASKATEKATAWILGNSDCWTHINNSGEKKNQCWTDSPKFRNFARAGINKNFPFFGNNLVIKWQRNMANKSGG